MPSLVFPILDLSKRYHPYRYHLQHVPWAVFGSLTWSDRSKRIDTNMARYRRYQDFTHLLFLTKKHFGIRPQNFAYYQCMEWSLADECHYHFLIAKRGTEKVSPALLAGKMENMWMRDKCIGRAVVKPFDDARHLAGVSYCLKREYDFQGRERERYDNPSPVLLRRLKRAGESITISPAKVSHLTAQLSRTATRPQFLK